MFRMRRYRVFLVFAIIAIGALYHFTSLADVENAGADSVEGLRKLASKGKSSSPPPASEPENGDTTGGRDTDGPIAMPSLAGSGGTTSSSSVVGESKVLPTTTLVTRPSLKDDSVDPEEEPTKSHTSPSVATPTSPVGSESGNKTTKPHSGPADPIINPHGEDGRLEIIALTTGIPKIHWSQQPEHFPVPTENIIQLPTGKPKALPKIQHDFKTETADEKADRLEKRDIIKKAFSFSWAGYQKKAWTQDELTPVSGKFRNPFNGWGATLVDSLDTLWMMGLKDEFEEAVEAVKHIDFTTSPRNDIPLFETVIRYLGGLVAAYDVSDGAHRILLDKAVELADILMGAFDTPNRMPITFYLWKPTFASQPHRAKTRVVLAELGSLSVEFTRLAQITKEARYYDAVARITNEFDIWQNNTRLPGLWPIKVDASGCKKPDMSSSQASHDHTAEYGSYHNTALIGESAQNPTLLHEGTAKKGLEEGVSPTAERIVRDTTEPAQESMQEVQPASSTKNSTEGAGAKKRFSSTSSTERNLSKREIDPETGLDPHPDTEAAKAPDCEPQGLASPPFTMTEDFGIGGQADSTYEYLPKEYMLLGGLEEKYRTMYEKFAEVTTENLLFRPMIPDERRYILHAGLARVDNKNSPLKLTPEGTHLTCFAGGMYAVGAKIFGREADMDIAKKLTDGCVWAYESTTTGIMPESYLVVQCPDPVDCPWNETLWHEKLDPYGHLREQQRAQQKPVVLKNEKEMTVKTSEEEVSLAESPKASFTAEQAVSQTEQSMAATSDTQASLTKAEQAVGKPVAEPVVPEQERAAKAVSKPTDGIATESDSTIPEKDAETSSSKPTEGAVPPKAHGKRQLGDVNEAPPAAAAAAAPVKSEVAAPSPGLSTEPVVEKSFAEQHLEKSNTTAQGVGSKALGSNSTSVPPNAAMYTPPPIPTREEYVQARIKDERLPEGMTKVTGGRYLLRPEAIESVFIMYRATGDVYWREKGWEMFKAIEKHTIATYGASAITDVTSEKPVAVDEMESFWLAETLKYFYLLFSEPTLISLDDYVLNTEAHAFKRPK